MSKKSFPILLAGVSVLSIAFASSATARDLAHTYQPEVSEPQVLYATDSPSLGRESAPVQLAAARGGQMGGGFIEFLFNGDQQPQRYQQPQIYYPQQPMQVMPDERLMQPRYDAMAPAQQGVDPRYEKQMVDYDGREAPGTIIIDTPNTYLYYVLGGGKAIRYGIGVGREGFTWSGVQTVARKAEWPDWNPPPEMIARQPYLPRFMAGGPGNPLGARAMYLGGTIYRIHGTNAPSTIGGQVSSGCIRLTNEDVTDLYERVQVGALIVVNH